jgi:hypothetical protein
MDQPEYIALEAFFKLAGARNGDGKPGCAAVGQTGPYFRLEPMAQVLPFATIHGGPSTRGVAKCKEQL